MNTTDEGGNNRFGVLTCRRCLADFGADELVGGEIPEHECLGLRCKSESSGGEHHYVVVVRGGRRQ